MQLLDYIALSVRDMTPNLTHPHLNVAQHQRSTSGVPLTDPLQPYLHGVPTENLSPPARYTSLNVRACPATGRVRNSGPRQAAGASRPPWTSEQCTTAVFQPNGALQLSS